jgi:hypothetical protein
VRVQLVGFFLLACVLAVASPVAGQRDETRETTSGQGSAAAQQQRLGGEIDVTAVSTVMVAFDRQGHAVLDLRPEEVQVLEDGKPVTVLELAPGVQPQQLAVKAEPVPAVDQVAVEAPPWRVVVYVSTELAGRFVLPELCRRTAAEAPRLTDLGPVDVVLADPSPKLITEAGSRPEDVQLALERVAAEASGLTAVERIRNGFTKEFKPGVGFDTMSRAEQASPRSFAVKARAAAYRERTVIRRDLDRMVAWIQTQPPTTRGLLVWMTGGFDLNPADFYIPMTEQLDPMLSIPLRTEYPTLSLDKDVSRVVEVALSYGWTVMPVNATRTSFLYGAEVDGTGKAQHYAGVGASTMDSQAQEFSQVAPDYPLRLVAKGTGGEFVANDRQLELALDRAKSAYQLSYQVDRPADGRLHRIEIRCSRQDVRLRSRDYAASGNLRGVATSRALRLLADKEIQGALAMSAEVSNVTVGAKGHRLGDLGLTADLSELRPMLESANLGRMRVTVAVEIEEGSPFIHHQELDVDWGKTSDVWNFVAGVSWPKKAKRMAVVLEELVSSTWGGAQVELK